MRSAHGFFITYMVVIVVLVLGLIGFVNYMQSVEDVRNNLLQVVKLNDPISLEENFYKIAEEGPSSESNCDRGEDVVYLLDEFNNIYIVERLYGETNQIRISKIPLLYSEWDTIEISPWFILYYESTDTNLDGVVTKRVVYKIDACKQGGVEVTPVLP